MASISNMPPTGTNEGLVAAEHIGREYPDVAVLVVSQYLELAYALRLVEVTHAAARPLVHGQAGHVLVVERHPAVVGGDLPGRHAEADLEDLIASIWGERDDRYSELRSASTSHLPRIEMFALGGWLALVCAAAAWTGPVTVLLVEAVAGGGGFLLTALLLAGRERTA